MRGIKTSLEIKKMEMIMMVKGNKASFRLDFGWVDGACLVKVARP